MTVSRRERGLERYGATVAVVDETGVTLKRLRSIAANLARSVRPGDLILLFGPLGAGKTTFIRAVAACVGVTDPVRSPSFTIANIYDGRVTVNHLDLFRLEEVGDEDALALEEYMTDDAVTMVEWPEAGLHTLGEADWIVRLDHETVRTRRLRLEATTEASRRWSLHGAAKGDE